MTDSNVGLEETETSGRYVYASDPKSHAELVFSKPDAYMIAIDHTEVPDVYRGQGIGLLLLERAVNDARANSYKIIPQKWLGDKTLFQTLFAHQSDVSSWMRYSRSVLR